MVEVDVFWAYGLGAALGAASGRQTAKKKRPLESKYFVLTLLFLAIIWAPTGMLLLIKHPSWETMQLADHFYSMPSWLVLLFGITNVTQGALGFWVSQRLMHAKKYYFAQLNWMAGYFGMFFILLYGWDGLGYDRFLYDRDMLPGSPAWTPGAGTADGLFVGMWNFLTSSVAVTLLIDGIYLIPPLSILLYVWYREAYRHDTSAAVRVPNNQKMLIAHLAGSFSIPILAAAFCAIVVNLIGALFGVDEHVLRTQGEETTGTFGHVVSYIIGLPLSIYILWKTVMAPGKLYHRLLMPLCITEDGVASNYLDPDAEHPQSVKELVY